MKSLTRLEKISIDMFGISLLIGILIIIFFIAPLFGLFCLAALIVFLIS